MPRNEVSDWKVGDRFKDGYAGTIVQLGEGLPEGFALVGFWRIVDRKRVAAYRIVRLERLRWAYRVEEKEKQASPRFTKTAAKRLYEKAHRAGVAALAEAKPTPMVVGTPKDPVASLLGGDGGGFDLTKPTYFVEGGVCGFAWITVHPGNSSLARRWKELGYASPAYGGGVQVWVREGGQSLERKEAYAQAFAEVVREAGVQAFSGSQID